jgi:hypothetical protein
LVSSVISLLLILRCTKYGFICVGIRDNIYVLDKVGIYCYGRGGLPNSRLQKWWAAFRNKGLLSGVLTVNASSVSRVTGGLQTRGLIPERRELYIFAKTSRWLQSRSINLIGGYRGPFHTGKEVGA